MIDVIRMIGLTSALMAILITGITVDLAIDIVPVIVVTVLLLRERGCEVLALQLVTVVIDLDLLVIGDLVPNAITVCEKDIFSKSVLRLHVSAARKRVI